jgi:ADP-ribosyl-[dinitrogen reductase] hydrolase
MPTFAERLTGGLYGLLIGDALGVPYEFHPPSALPPLAEIEMTPPSGFRRTYPHVPVGTWSDDGAQALVLLVSLLENRKLDLDDFGRRLVAWADEGFMAVGKQVFDIGIQTSQAVARLRSGVPAAQASSSDERANGNGSLMRVLPLALWHRGSDAELVADAHRQSLVTHGHVRSQVCCALYCLWARRTLEGNETAWETAVANLRDIYASDSPERIELDTVIRPDDPPSGQGSGYVVDCLNSARLVQQAGSYEQVVKAAVALGNDTDTTACVAGGIAGLRDGFEAIPLRWREQLREPDLVARLMQGLMAWRAVA